MGLATASGAGNDLTRVASPEPTPRTNTVVTEVGRIEENQIVRIYDPETRITCFAVAGHYSSGGGFGTAISCLPAQSK
jgi:hypothetical protein